MKSYRISIFSAMVVLLSIFEANAQEGFGTSTPAPSSVVDMVASDKGVLFPRVALTGIEDTVTISAPADALTVFNTATTTTGTNDVTPGYYYWNDAADKWIRLMTEVTASNGLNVGVGTHSHKDVKLGGALINPTVISGLTETNSLSILGTGVNMFNVDGTTLSVDGANDRVGIGTVAPDFNLEALGTVGFPTVASTPVAGPYSAVGINDATGKLGIFTPGSSPTFVRRTSAEQLDITLAASGSLANIHGSNTSLINTVGVIHNDEYLQIPQAGVYRIDYTVTGRVAATSGAASVALNLRVLVNDVEVTQDRFLVVDQNSINVPSTIPIIVELQANDRLQFRYRTGFPTSGTPRVDIRQGQGANYSQQIIITKL